jgi:hypothetical protein
MCHLARYVKSTVASAIGAADPPAGGGEFNRPQVAICSGPCNWVRRCSEKWQDGRYVLEQDTNAYAVLPSSQWHGYKEPPEAPPPAAGTWPFRRMHAESADKES